LNSVTRWLDYSAEKYKDKIAFIDNNKSITFSELRENAMHIASELIKMEVFRQPIMISMPKSVDMITAILGVAYSGNFYTPIDISAPNDRTNNIVNLLNPQAIIFSNKKYIDGYDLGKECRQICFEEALNNAFSHEAVEQTASRIIDKDLLYVLFTSGSTGVPKGVMISHRSVINYIKWISQLTSMTEKDVLGNEAPLYFDLSIQDIYAPLKVGCTCLLLEKSLFSFPGALMKRMYEQGVSKIFWVPTALCIVANMKGLNSKFLPRFNCIAFCGEVMPCKQLNVWRKACPSARIFNLYGPTEACDSCMAYEVNREFSDDDTLPMGWPAENTDIFLEDDDRNVIYEKEIVGEICIRGSALSYGYYNNEIETERAFVKQRIGDAFIDTVYHTGDLGKLNEFDEYVFCGRKDYQIKHLGHRIELGEIEIQTVGKEGVELAAAVYVEENDKIILFCSGKADSDAILNHLARKVPEYMLPAEIIILKDLYRNNNGKIDRKQLLEEYRKCNLKV